MTGSKSLVVSRGRCILVDCGLYQGVKDERERNWAPLPVPAESLDAVVLTHAHIDHSGYLPALVRQGFDGPVYCSEGTRDLCQVLLPDAGFLQEEDARYANKKGFSKHKPARPLFTEEDARRSLKLFQPLEFNKQHELSGGLTLRLRRAGHIIGASSLELVNGTGSVRIFGQDIPVKAKVFRLENLSAHGDYQDILSWLGKIRQPPKEILINHGTSESSQGLAEHIRENFGWEVRVPTQDEVVTIPDIP